MPRANSYSFAGTAGTYVIDQVHAECWRIWLHTQSTIIALPCTYDVLDALWLAEVHNNDPKELETTCLASE